MVAFGLLLGDKKRLFEQFARFPEIETVIIFGSRALGNFRPGSDIDLAIVGKKVSEEVIHHLHYRLEEEIPLPYFFDVVHYETINAEPLKQHIDQFGKVLYLRHG